MWPVEMLVHSLTGPNIIYLQLYTLYDVHRVKTPPVVAGYILEA